MRRAVSAIIISMSRRFAEGIVLNDRSRLSTRWEALAAGWLTGPLKCP
jgi:hypothetical protein